MKKFLLLTLAALLISPCVSETTIKNSNNNHLIGNNNDSIVSEQSEDTYTIRFLNDEGTEISSNQYKFGVMPEAPAATPEKENPLDEYTYTFSGWSPSIGLVTANVDYVATYKADAKIGKVIWVDGDDKTLLSEDYAYGSMPNYHGDIPTKTATDTETYVFKGWSPEISVVSKESTTYVAQFSTVKEKYSIQINCTDCLVNKKKFIKEEHNVLSDLAYQFNTTSKETYHHPYKLEVTVDDKVSNDYAYDNITGELNIKLTGNTVINAVADNSCVLMKYKYSTDYPTVEIYCNGDFECIDWGDGAKNTEKEHTYSYSSETNQYDIRVFGKLSYIGAYSHAITEVGIFHSVTSIGSFSNCSSLISITIPNSVTLIDDFAFCWCSSLTSIAIPNSVTSIGGRAFGYCSNLTSIIIPNSVTSIGDYAFYNCPSLTSIAIPSSVTSIGRCVFFSCPSLTSIVVDKENPKYDSRENCNAIIETQLNKLVTGCKNTIIHNSVTSIGDSAFEGCSSLTSIAIPNSVTLICDSAFRGCSSLTSITIPNSVTSIGEYTFFNCSSLTTFDLLNLNHVIDIESTIFSSNYVPTIKVKANMLEKYKTDSNWSQYSDYIVGV